MSSSGTVANTQYEDGVLKRMWTAMGNFFTGSWAKVKASCIGMPQASGTLLPDPPPTLGVLNRSFVDYELLQRCVALYNGSFGRLKPGHFKVGNRLTTTATRLLEDFLFDDRCFLSVLRVKGVILGYMFFKRFPSSSGDVIWITQLAVSAYFRRKGFARRLIRTAIDFETTEGTYAIGMVTNHPYAIRALESATGREVIGPDGVAEHAPSLIGMAKLTYLLECPIEGASINTNFVVDQTEQLAILEKLQNWKLGPLKDGHEFVGIVLFD